MGNHTINIEVVGTTGSIREEVQRFIKEVQERWGSYSIMAVTLHHWGDAPEDLTPKR